MRGVKKRKPKIANQRTKQQILLCSLSNYMKKEINIAIEKLEKLRFKPKSFPEFMGVQGSEAYSYTQEDEREYRVWQQIGFQYNSQLDEVITLLRKLIQHEK